MLADKGEFFLKGFAFDSPIEFSFESRSIQINADIQNQNKLNLLEKELNKVSITGTLSICSRESKKDLLNLAIDIKNLLSIALGNRIIFDKQQYWFSGVSKIENREMSKNFNSGQQIVPDFELQKYLEQTLPIWFKYSKQQKDDIFIITNYLNQTTHDFIEDRILRTVQAWECCCHYWIDEVELTDELKNLKTRIKQFFKDWKNETNFNDLNGELGKKLVFSLEQEKLLIKLNKLVIESGLKVEDINLDLRSLKNLRDQVVHTGRIGITGSEAIRYLIPGITGLQLILLRRLGYRGLVIGETEGFKTFEKIEKYFK